jgi:DNA-binding GntR family transcriptional regulator
MAARIAAERGLDARTLDGMQACIDAVGRMTADNRELDDVLRQQWRGHNALFHRLLHEAVGNRYLIESLALIQRIPLVHHAVTLYYNLDSVKAYNAQHQEILRAIGMRQGTRAAHLMWEHVMAGQGVIRDRLDRNGAPAAIG